MRQFYSDEAPIDTLLQLAAGPVWDGNLVSKVARDAFVDLEWVARCEGYNILTSAGQKVIRALKLKRMRTITIPEHAGAALGSALYGQPKQSATDGEAETDPHILRRVQ